MVRRAKLPTDLEPLAVGLEQARKGPGFDVVTHSEIASVLISIFPFRGDFTDTERRRIVNRGIGGAAASGPITRASLESHIRREEQEALNGTPTQYVLASNLSFTRFGALRPRQFAGGIQLVRFLPQRFLDARSKEGLGIAEQDRLVRDYVGVLTRVTARSPTHAFDLAINRLDLLRGIWNFAHVRPTVWASNSDPTAPLARIRFSRVHTLHDRQGAPATNTHWFNPEFRLQTSTSLSDAHWNHMLRFMRSVRQRLPRIPYRSDLERAFISYGRALDATDMESAFLKLWSILELISGVGGERYDTLIARAAFLFEPSPVMKYVLEHLRYQRNEIVHLGTPQSEMRPLVYQLKLYVEQMMAVHLAIGRHFASLDEAGQFMDLNQEPATLRRRIALIERAIKFRGL